MGVQDTEQFCALTPQETEGIVVDLCRVSASLPWEAGCE